MSLYERWHEVAFKHETKQKEEAFWEQYLGQEKAIYEHILGNKMTSMEGTVKELSTQFKMSPEFFCGFLDGINGSLKTPIQMEQVEEDTTVALEIDFEKLYKEMVEYKAEHLYTLSQWDDIFDEEKRKRLFKEQKSSKTIVKKERVGRNDPCPCGSGKKYKKCCGN